MLTWSLLGWKWIQGADGHTLVNKCFDDHPLISVGVQGMSEYTLPAVHHIGDACIYNLQKVLLRVTAIIKIFALNIYVPMYSNTKECAPEIRMMAF